MAYKDKEKQKQAVRQAVRRSRARQQGITSGSFCVIPVIPDQASAVIPKAPMFKLYGTTPLGAKPRASDSSVQAIWDKRNAQGQPAGYSEQATDKDYPQTQRPTR